MLLGECYFIAFCLFKSSPYFSVPDRYEFEAGNNRFQVEHWNEEEAKQVIASIAWLTDEAYPTGMQGGHAIGSYVNLPPPVEPYPPEFMPVIETALIPDQLGKEESLPLYQMLRMETVLQIKQELEVLNTDQWQYKLNHAGEIYREAPPEHDPSIPF